jgi:hypothetical protein
MPGDTLLNRDQSSSSPQPRPKTLPPKTFDIWVDKMLQVSLDELNGGVDLQAPTKDPIDVNQLTATAKTQGLVGDALLASLPQDDDIDALRDVLTQHKDRVPTETKVFKLGRGWLEHIDDLARIQKPEERQKKVKEIQDVLNAVATRRKDLTDAIDAVAARPNPSEDMQEALKFARTTLSTISVHLPFYFQDPYVEKELQRRLKTLAASPEEKAELLKKAKAGFVDSDGTPVVDDNGNPVGDGLRDTFKGVIEKIGTRDFDRQNYYFDQITGSISPEDGKKLYQANDYLVEQGQLILDCGGTLRDVQQMLAKTGVPEDWWPPRLVENLQAWRKTERALQQERVGNLIEKKKPDLDSVEGIMDFMFSELPELGASVCEFFDDNEIAKAVKELLDGIKDGFETGAVGLSALKSLDFDELEPTTRQKLLNGLEKAMSNLEGALNSASASLNIAKDLGAQHLAAVIPGLSIAACGVNLALAIKKLSEHTAVKVQTHLMKNDAFKALGNAQMTDGGAFLETLGNEINGRNTQISKDGIEVTTSSMDLAGSIAGTAGGHFGLAAQAGLKITSTAITYGSKVVFTNIDWSEADRAKKMLKEARAGNPVARMQIFKESNLYAKMYICVLARDANPLALKFIDQRGIEESDLSTPMSLKILREALLASADQKDENDIDDSRTMENLGKIGKFGKFVGKGAKALGNKAKEVTKDRKIAYKSVLLPYDPDKALTRAEWDKTKKIAVGAGLYDEATGVGDALADYESALAKVSGLITAGKELNPETKDGKKAQENFLAVLEALATVQGAVDGCTATINPDGKQPHPEMASYVAAMLKTARAKYNMLDQTMVDLGLKNPAWKAPASGPELDAAIWKKNWADAVLRACLPEWDGDVGTALDAVAKAEADIVKAKDAEAKRKARLAAVDALNDTIAGAKQCWGLARGVTNMLANVDKVLKAAGDRRIALDKELAPDTWQGMPKVDPPEAVTAAKWQSFWDSAVKAGMCVKDDGGVLAATLEMEKRFKAAADAQAGKPKLKARQDYGIAIGKLIVARNKLLTVQRDVAKPIKDYVENIYQHGLTMQQELSSQRDQVAFLTIGGATVAGWKQSYGNAIEAGAVPPAKAGAKALEKGLGAYEAAIGKMQIAVKAKKFQEARKQAVLAKVGLDEADVAVWQKLLTADGYATNKQMSGYLGRIRTGIMEFLDAEELKQALSGTATGANFTAGKFTLDPKAFSTTKAAAIENGVIADTKTGTSGALEKCQKSLAELIKANTATKPDQGTIDKARKTAVADANALLAVVKKLAALAPDNKVWKGYAESAVTVATDHLKNVTDRKN